MEIGCPVKFADAYGKEIGIAAVVILCTSLLFVWIFGQNAARKGRKLLLPPGPKGWPLVRGLPYVGEFPHKSFYDLSKEYGPIMFLQLGSMPVVVVSNAEMAKEVLQANDQCFASRPSMMVPNFLFYGNQDIAFAPYGAHWRQARKIVNLQLLTPSKLAYFTGMIKDEILSTVQTILERSQSDGIVNSSFVIAGMTMNIITQMMWNKKYRNVKGGGEIRDDARFDDLIKTILSLLGPNIADFLPPVLRSPVMKLSGRDKKAKDLLVGLGEFCEGIIREKEQLLAQNADADAPADEDDFLSVLLKLKRESGESSGLSREAIQSILIDMIVGGTDTSSVQLDWTFTELMSNPDIMRRLQDELSAVVGEDRLVDETDIPKLKYLDAVVKESLRKWSGLGIPHMSISDCKIGRYDIPANTTVFISIYAIHHDERVWEKPWEYNPDRFLQREFDYRGRNFEFIPFSSGRRICPGMNLASTSLHLGLAQLLHTIEWSLPDGQTPESVDFKEFASLVVGRASPMLLKAKPRLAHDVIYPKEGK